MMFALPEMITRKVNPLGPSDKGVRVKLGLQAVIASALSFLEGGGKSDAR